MAYAQLSNIEAIDYNNLAWGSSAGGTYVTSSANKNVAVIWGVGSGRYGWGQSVSSIPKATTTATTGSLATVVATDDVTAASWNGLILAINKALYHTGTANIALTGVSVGSTVTYYSTISTGTTSAWNAAGTGAVVTTSDDAAFTSTNTVTWANSIGFVFTASFDGADEMRYFFNAGGKLKVSLTGPAGTGRNLDWRTLCTSMGTIVFGYNTTTKSGGSGSPTTLLSTAGNGGFWGPHTSGVDREDFLQYSTGSAYTSNYIQVLTKVTGAVGTNGGKGVTLTITINMVDDDVNIYQPNVASGTVASLIVTRPASGSLDTSVWGTISKGVTKTTDAGTTTAYVVPTGSQTFTAVGETTFTVPADVTTVSILCVAPGKPGSSFNISGGVLGAGGAGGGTAYIASLAVTPGQTLYLRVGDKNGTGTDTYTGVSTTAPIDSSTNYILATQGSNTGPAGGGSGIGVGPFASAIGGTGGSGGPRDSINNTGGGGGAAGYGGPGGNGGYAYVEGNQQTQGRYIFGAGGGGTGGGGGGGGYAGLGGRGGGGIGLNGIGAPGVSGGGTSTQTTNTQGFPGGGGSGGAAGSGQSNGGSYGGGGGMLNGVPGGAAVRIIWGPGRTYPSSAA